MHRLELNYVPRSRHGVWLGVAAVVLAALIGAKMVDVYVLAKRESLQLEARIVHDDARQQAHANIALPEAVILEIHRANDVIEQIALPWDRLFRAIDSATGGKIALLSITPDPKAGTVEIGGEAVDLGAMFDYVKRLQGQHSLTRVYLVNHKINDRDPQHPINFTVTASWVEKTSEL